MIREKNIYQRILSLWLPVILWAFVIFLLSSKPAVSVSEIDVTDFIIKKCAHIVEYAIFSTLLYRALYAGDVNKRKAGVYSILIALFYGLSDEFHQSFTPGRDPKLRDVFFDITGAIIAVYSIWNLLPKAPPKILNLAKNLQIIKS
jgi:VanZ family protein